MPTDLNWIVLPSLMETGQSLYDRVVSMKKLRGTVKNFPTGNQAKGSRATCWILGEKHCLRLGMVAVVRFLTSAHMHTSGLTLHGFTHLFSYHMCELVS